MESHDGTSVFVPAAEITNSLQPPRSEGDRPGIVMSLLRVIAYGYTGRFRKLNTLLNTLTSHRADHFPIIPCLLFGIPFSWGIFGRHLFEAGIIGGILLMAIFGMFTMIYAVIRAVLVVFGLSFAGVSFSLSDAFTTAGASVAQMIIPAFGLAILHGRIDPHVTALVHSDPQATATATTVAWLLTVLLFALPELVLTSNVYRTIREARKPGFAVIAYICFVGAGASTISSLALELLIDLLVHP